MNNETNNETHDHAQENTATGILAGLLLIILTTGAIWAMSQTTPPDVSLVSADSVHVEGHGSIRIDSLRHYEELTERERLHVMKRTASHLSAYQMGYEDATGTQPSEQDLLWLARAAYVEARSDGLYSMYLVANVVMNRKRSHRYPNTVKEVVLDPHQITGMWDQEHVWQAADMDMQRTSWRNALRAAHLALTTPERLRPFAGNVYHYYSPVSMQPQGSTPYWAENHTPVYSIDNRFIFYAGIS